MQCLGWALFCGQRWIQDSLWEGTPTLQGGVPIYDFVKISTKLHEIEKKLGAGVGGEGGVV